MKISFFFSNFFFKLRKLSVINNLKISFLTSINLIVSK